MKITLKVLCLASVLGWSLQGLAASNSSAKCFHNKTEYDAMKSSLPSVMQANNADELFLAAPPSAGLKLYFIGDQLFMTGAYQAFGLTKQTPKPIDEICVNSSKVTIGKDLALNVTPDGKAVQIAMYTLAKTDLDGFTNVMDQLGVHLRQGAVD